MYTTHIETGSLAYELYDMHKKDYPLAGFMDSRPEYVAAIVSDGEVVGLISSTVADGAGSTRWLIPVWGAKRGHAKKLLEEAKKMIGRHRKTDVLITHIQVRHSTQARNYLACKIMANRLGFRTIASNEVCDVVQIRGGRHGR